MKNTVTAPAADAPYGNCAHCDFPLMTCCKDCNRLVCELCEFGPADQD